MDAYARLVFKSLNQLVPEYISEYIFFYVLKELRHLINDIKLDTVLTINKPLTKNSPSCDQGKGLKISILCIFYTLNLDRT